MKRAQQGVTLIELVIAITLMSLLTVGLLFAMRIGLSTLERSNQRFTANRRVLGVDRVMHLQLASLLPAKAECRPAPNAAPTEVPFFHGEPQMMRFASTYSLEEASRGTPRILEYLVIPGDQGEGVRLIVNEIVYFGPASAGASCIGVLATPNGLSGRYRPVEVGPRAFVLADKLARCFFSYKEELKEPPYERWTPAWRSARFPNAVRIEMAPLQAKGAQLEVLPVTVDLHVTRDPLVKYAN